MKNDVNHAYVIAVAIHKLHPLSEPTVLQYKVEVTSSS